MNEKELRKNLLKLADNDQEYRKRIFKQGHVRTPEELEMLKNIDALSTGFMIKVLDEFGLPTIQAVGRKASFDAWLLVQHSMDLNLQKRYLVLLKSATREQVKPEHAAYLEDRILMYEGKPQIYGTQVIISKTTGKLEPYLIANPDKVNELRALVGLESLEEYVATFYK